MSNTPSVESGFGHCNGDVRRTSTHEYLKHRQIIGCFCLATLDKNHLWQPTHGMPRPPTSLAQVADTAQFSLTYHLFANGWLLLPIYSTSQGPIG